MKVSESITDKVQSTIPIGLQIQGAHLYDKTRRWVTGTNGKKIFVESPIPPVEDVELADIDLSNPFLYRQGRWQSYFERVRNEAPVHYQPNSPFGPFWSVTRHADIVAVDKNHAVFSAEPFIVIGVPPRFLDIEMFIAMDPPRHDKQRAAVQGVVAPKNLREMEGLIRSRVREVLDDLPLNEPFDWGAECLDRVDSSDARNSSGFPLRTTPHTRLLVRFGNLDGASQRWALGQRRGVRGHA